MNGVQLLQQQNKLGGSISVWDKEELQYKDISIGDFNSDLYSQNEQSRYVFSGDDASFTDQKGNIVTTNKVGEFYNYTKNGYQYLDKDIVSTAQKYKAPTSALGKVAEGFEAGASSLASTISFGLSDKFIEKAGGREAQIRSQMIRDRNKIAKYTGVGVGFIGGGGIAKGVSWAAAKTGQYGTARKVLGKAFKSRKAESYLNPFVGYSRLLAKGGEKVGKIATIATGGRKGLEATGKANAFGLSANIATQTAAFSVPYAAVDMLSHKDPVKFAEDLKAGVTVGGMVGLGVGGVIGVGKLGKVALSPLKGAASVTANWSERQYMGLKKAQEVAEFTQKIGNSAKVLLGSKGNEAALERGFSLLSKEQRVAIFGKNKPTKAEIQQKAGTIWDKLDNNGKLSVGISLQKGSAGKSGVKGGLGYEAMYNKSVNRIDELASSNNKILGEAAKVQSKEIAHNQSLAETLRGSDFMSKMFSASGSIQREVGKKVREFSTAHVKGALNKLNSVKNEGLATLAKDQQKIIYYLELNLQKATKTVGKETQKFNRQQAEGLYGFLKKEGFTDPQVGTLMKFYQEALTTKNAAYQVAKDAVTMQRLLSSKKLLTNGQNQELSRIVGKYKNLKDMFGNKAFQPLKDKADDVAATMLPKDVGLITKDMLKKIITQSYAGIGVGARVFKGSAIKREQKLLLDAVDDVLGGRPAMTVQDLSKFRQNMNNLKNTFRDNGTSVTQSYDDFIMGLSSTENKAWGEVMKHPSLQKFAKGKNLELQKKEISLGLEFLKKVGKAQGADVSTFILKEPLMAGLGMAGIATGGALGGLAGVAGGFVMAQALKGGRGFLGMAERLRQFHTSFNKTGEFLKQSSQPGTLLQMFDRKSVLEFGALETFKATQINQAIFGTPFEQNLPDISGNQKREHADDIINLQVQVQSALANPESLKDENNLGAMSSALMDDLGVNNPATVGLMEMNNYKQLLVLQQNLSRLGIKNAYTNREIEKFERDVSVMFKPQNIVGFVKKGQVSYEMADNFKQMFPKKYSEMRYMLVEQSLNGKLKGMDFKTKNQLSKLLGYDFTGLRGGVVDEDLKGLGRASQPNVSRDIKVAEEQQKTAARSVETL